MTLHRRSLIALPAVMPLLLSSQAHATQAQATPAVNAPAPSFTGTDSNGAPVDDNDVDDDNEDVNNGDKNNLPPHVGKRNDGCDETKTEEEETVTDSVAIHTTIKQITGRGGGRWQRLRR